MTNLSPTADAPSGGPMLNALAKNWWVLLIRGLCAIVFGVLTFVWPGVSLLTLIFLYGIFALADGVVAIAAAIMGGAAAPRWWLALVGLAGIAAGILTFVWPGITALVLLYFIAFWAIAIGVMEIIGAIRLRKEIEGEWLLGLTGLVTMLFGLFMLFQPAAGILAVIWMIGIWAIVMGVLQVALSFRLRSWKHA